MTARTRVFAVRAGAVCLGGVVTWMVALALVVGLGLLRPGAVHGQEDAGDPGATLDRAYALLEADSVEAGRQVLLAAVDGLEPSRATRVIQLAALLEALPSRSASLAARSAAMAHRGALDEALEVLVTELDDSGAEDAPLLLAHAARLADEGGRPDAGAALRERLLEEHSDAPASAEAALELARWHARTSEGVPAAVALLETLILARPNSPVVPTARRELERLSDGLPRPGGTS